MGTPNENIATLERWWAQKAAIDKLNANDQAQAVIYNHDNWHGLLHKASSAMSELVDVAAKNEHVRKIFAVNLIFMRTLAVDATPGSILSLVSETGYRQKVRQPRLVMLDGIRKAAIGGFFTTADPSGLTTWISSPMLDSSAILQTINKELIAEVLLAMLGLLANAGVPLIWASLFGQPGGPLDGLRERIPTTKWGDSADGLLAAQSQLLKAVNVVQGRYQDALAKEAAKKLPPIPTFPTGDGTPAPTLPPAPKPWYKRGEIIVPAIGGIGLGVWFESSPKRVK